MKFRFALATAVLSFCLALLSPSIASASNRQCESTPAHVPALDLLSPVSSTSVHPGTSVSVEFDFVHVFPHPSAHLIYKKHQWSHESVVPLDLNGKVNVPSDWRTGHYKLVRIDVDGANGSTGSQFRDGHFSGHTASGEAVTGCSPLDLKALDLRVR